MALSNISIEKSIDSIVEQIKLEKVIPIIGYDLLFNEFEDKNEGDFLMQVIKLHAKRDGQILQTDKKTGYELVNDYYHSLTDADPDTFKSQLSNTIQAERFNWNLIPESFRKLASIKHFKLFINATFTNSIELALNTYRAEGTNEQEIKDSYSVLNYHSSQPEDLPIAAPPLQKFRVNFDKSIIYNLFGTHDGEPVDYVLTDSDYVELIYDLMVNKQDRFVNLLSYLNTGYLLFLGCNFPDWFFRFFIRICAGEKLDYVSPIKRKAVIDSLILNKADESRSLFIGFYKIQTLDIDCNILVNEIYKRLSNKPGMSSVLGDRKNNNVFISYCRKDEKVAKDVAAQFDEKYIEYFLDDNDLLTGDNLNNKITDAIDRCCLFLPVVSNNVQAASPYVWKEWKYATDHQKEIWPVFKDFVDAAMLLPAVYGVTADLREKFLDKNTTLGIVPEGDDNKIPEIKLSEIKKKQYYSRVSGNKQSIKD
jgi:hypothetical protein